MTRRETGRDAAREPGARLRRAVATAAALAILALFAFQILQARARADRAIGVFLGPLETGLEISNVVPGDPADRAGVEAGDRLLSVAGFPIVSESDYDIAAAELRRGEPTVFRLGRDGRVFDVAIEPGVGVRWLPLWISLGVILTCLALGLLAIHQRGRDLRARLVACFAFLLALELALPLEGASLLVTVPGNTAFYLVTGAQLAVMLHLAAVLPTRRAFLRRHPWLVPCGYALGLGLGFLAAAAYLVEGIGGQAWLPWSQARAEWLLFDVAFVAFAVAVPSILVLPALRHPHLAGRHQAGLIFLGILPWTIYILAGSLAQLAGSALPLWTNELFPLITLCFPIAVFIAIFRYQLLDIELVVRRSVLYTLLTALLVAVFYGIAGLVGAALARGVDDARRSMWVVAGAMFFVGLAFGTLRDRLQRWIDQRLYPERQALRRHLIELAAELPALGTVAAMGRHLVERLRSIFAVSSVTLLLAETRNNLFLTIASSPSEGDDWANLSFLISPDDPGLERLRRSGRPLPVEVLGELSPLIAQRFGRHDAAALAVPLMAHERMVGVLVLGRPEARRRFPREEVELLSLVGHQAATAFENVRLYESATFEGLTGLLRREAILEHLDREIERALRYQRPLILGMVDIDHFKSINDRFGHLAGDAVLKRVADELAAGLRTSDAVGRYGGEEFLIVLPETDADGGLGVADKLRRRIAGLELPMPGGEAVRPRISIGLAALDGSTTESELSGGRQHLVDVADQALYRAKRLGRNRVELGA